MTLPDIDSFDTYGGAKENYAPVEDPNTDRDAADANQAYCSAAAMTQTATRAWARFVGSATAPALASVNPNDGTWPNVLGNKPAIVRNSTGNYTLTWPTAVQDANGVVHDLNFRCVRASIEGTTFGFSNSSVTTSNSVTVLLADTAGTANDFAGKTILVEII